MAINPFKSMQDATLFNSAAAVTPSDTLNIATGVTRGVYVGGTGDLKVTMADGAVVTFKAVPVGLYPFQVLQVFSTGTTATNIVAVY